MNLSKKRPPIFFFLAFVLIFIFISNTVLGDNPPSDPDYKAEILKNFDSSQVQRLTIKFKDGSENYFRVNFSEPVDKRINDAKLRKNYFRSIQKNVLSKLPLTDYKLIGELSRGVVIETSKSNYFKLQNDPSVEVIYPERLASVKRSESVPLINANDVWSILPSFTGSGQTVCVIDSGVDYTHTDLGGCIGSSCKVSAGYDFCGDGAKCGDMPADTNPLDLYGHGTHVAGIISGKGSVNGTAPT